MENRNKLLVSVVVSLSLGLSLNFYNNFMKGSDLKNIHIPSKKFYTQLFLTKELSQKNYSIISASVPDFMNDTNSIFDGKAEFTPRAWGYLFQLPITALAWRRIGIRTVAILTLNYNNIQPHATRLLRHVTKTLERLNVTVVYFNVPSYMKARLGQILRLTAGEFGLFNDDDYLITSDADLWPIEARRYRIAPGKKIFVTNSKCCGHYIYNGKMYEEFPMSHIVLTTKLWKTIFGGHLVASKTNRSYDYADIKPLLHKLERFTNDSAALYSPAMHGRGLWSLDQRYATVLVKDYIDDVDNTTAQLIPGMGSTCPRIITSRWKKLLNEKNNCFTDAHVFKDHGWSDSHWKDLRKLTVQLFENKTLAFIEGYRTLFKHLYEQQ